MKKKINKNHRYLKTIAIVFATTFVSLLMYVVGMNGQLYRTSVVSLPEHKPFNGTVAPIKKVPNWVKLGSDKWNSVYSQLSSSELIDLPTYDPSQLSKTVASLKWGVAADDAVRNAKITYSVPYMGSYKLNGEEYAGSHLAVDLKIPTGTPVYAIANGTVTKVSNIESGFGHHIVIQHNNVPSLDNSDAKVTLYSTYNHLSDVLVKVGDVVDKGQQIALSGSTGTATTPHLHFQIDNDSAPWHPFWPFTWKEASDAGLDFFTAVNAGLGKDVAMTSTVSPMKYVQKYKDYNGAESYVSTTNTSTSTQGYTTVANTNTSGTTASTTTTTTGNTATTTTATTTTATTDTTVVETQPDPYLVFEIKTKPKYFVGQAGEYTIYMKDQYGKKFEGGFTDAVVVTSNDGYTSPKPTMITTMDFDQNGELKGSFSELKIGRDRLKIAYKSDNFYSDWFEIADPTQDDQLFSDVTINNQYFTAISYLAAKGVVNGYNDGTFKPEKTVTRAESLKLIFEGTGKNMVKGKLTFTDTSDAEWYAKYLYTAARDKVVDGYADGTFKPANTVSRAEFFKILFNGMEVYVDKEVAAAPYSDVSKEAWYAPYVAYAKSQNIIDNASKFRPNDGMTRGEVADAIYRLMKAKEAGSI